MGFVPHCSAGAEARVVRTRGTSRTGRTSGDGLGTASVLQQGKWYNSGMTVDSTTLLKALKKEKDDIPDALKREIAEDVHDYITRRMGDDEEPKSNA